MAIPYRLNPTSESIAKRGDLRPVEDYFIEQGRLKNITEHQKNEL